MTNLENLHAAIIEAVPEINQGGFHDQDLKRPRYRPITLADVLRAIPKHDLTVDVSAHFLYAKYQNSKTMCWDLTKNLDDQSPECIDFLTSVLCNDLQDNKTGV